MKQKSLPLILATILLLVFSACRNHPEKGGTNNSGNKKIPNVLVEAVSVREMVEKIVLPGLVHPDREVIISAEVGGILERQGPAKGQSIKKGEVLAEIDRKNLKAQLEQAEALVLQSRLAKDEAELETRRSAKSVETSKSQVEQAGLSLKQARRLYEKSEINLNNQRKHFERISKLYDEKLVSRAAYDDAESTVKSMEADLESAGAGIEAAEEAVRIAEGNLDNAVIQDEAARLRIHTAESRIETSEAALTQARLQYEKSMITAPFEARIDDIFLEEGEFVKAEAALVKLIRTDPVKIKVSLPEKDIPFIKTGHEATISISSLPGITKLGTVSFVGLSSDTRTNTYPVEITAANPDGAIKPGMISQVTLVRKRVSDAVGVPSFSVIVKEKEDVVFVLEEGRAVRRIVTTGILENGWIQITEGLSPGESLIIKGHRDLEDGQEVKVL